MCSLEHCAKSCVLLCSLCKWKQKSKKLKKKRLFFQIKIFADDKTRYKNRLWWESSMNFKTAPATPGRLTALAASRFVCVSVYSPLWTPMRTLRSKLLLGNKKQTVSPGQQNPPPCSSFFRVLRSRPHPPPSPPAPPNPILLVILTPTSD